MPHTSSSSSTKRSDTSKRARKLPRDSSAKPSKGSSSTSKSIVFGSVEVIPDFPASGNIRHPVPNGPKPGFKLRRSPTPVLTSLTDLTNAHLKQLSGVWNEKNLPNFDADKRAIAATIDGKDPFDF